jgi:hypothetical protein
MTKQQHLHDMVWFRVTQRLGKPIYDNDAVTVMDASH